MLHSLANTWCGQSSSFQTFWYVYLIVVFNLYLPTGKWYWAFFIRLTIHFTLLAPWLGSSLTSVSWDSCRAHLSHLSRITDLCCLMSIVWKDHCFISFLNFLIFQDGGSINLVSLTPSWAKAHTVSLFVLQWVLIYKFSRLSVFLII